MISEMKDKNWLRRHWIISIVLGLIVIGMIGSIFNSGDDPTPTGNAVNEQDEEIQEQVETCVSNWNCSSWSKCDPSEVQKRKCLDSNNCGIDSEKPSETQSCTYKTEEKKETTSSDSWLDNFNEALKELNESLGDVKEQQNIYKKIDKCTELSAGESINIPAVKNEFYMVCYEIYYYGGESALDEYIAELK